MPRTTHWSVVAYDIAPASWLRHIVDSGGMSDRTPSCLLRDMWEVYPNNMRDKVLEQYWYSKLLPECRKIVVELIVSLDTLTEPLSRTPLHEPRLRPRHGKFPRRQKNFFDWYQLLESTVLALTAQVSALAIAQAAPNRPSRNERETRTAVTNAPHTRSLPRSFKKH